MSPADAAGVQPQTTFAYTAYTASGYPTFYLPTSQTSKITSGSTVVTTSYAYSTQSALATLTHNLTGTAQDQTTTYTRNQVQEITGQSWWWCCYPGLLWYDD